LLSRREVISLTAEYALRAMVLVYLAGQPKRCAKTPRIASATQVPAKYLRNVMRTLAMAGLVEAKRGPDGGHTLACPPSEVTVLDVINAVGKRRRVVPCPVCTSHRPCPLHRRLDEGVELVESLFRRTTLDQLVPSENVGVGPGKSRASD
jgi:Rrf2 family transcriptional regulator, nitric oxide-sensitive transcriptional repressor